MTRLPAPMRDFELELLFDVQSSPGSGTTVWYRLHEGALGPLP